MNDLSLTDSNAAPVQMLETPPSDMEATNTLYSDTATNTLLGGSDVMETSPSPFAAPVDTQEEEFRPQFPDTDTVDEQKRPLMYGMAEREEKRRREKQSRLMDVLRAGAMDEAGRKKAAELWGQETLNRLELANEHDRAYMLGQRVMEVIGDGDRITGHQIYKNANNLWGTDVVFPDQIWKDFQGRHGHILDEERRQKESREKLASSLDPLIDRYVRGNHILPSPEQMKMMQESGVPWESVRKARMANTWIQEYRHSATLYDDVIFDGLHDIVGDDEVAKRIVLNVFYRDAKRDARLAYAESPTGITAIDAVTQTVAAPIIRGTQRVLRSGQKTVRVLQNGMQREDGVNADVLEGRRQWEAALTATLSQAESDYSDSGRLYLAGRVASATGEFLGDTMQLFAPGAGAFAMYLNAKQSRNEEGALQGLDWEEGDKRAMLYGATDAAVEKIAFGKLGKLVPGFGRLKKLVGMTSRAERLAPWRAKFLSSPTAQFLTHSAMGMGEEAVLEPTAGYVMRSTANLFLNDERGMQTFEQYLEEMGQMMAPENAAALAVFSTGLSSLNIPHLRNDSLKFKEKLTEYQGAGGSTQGFMDAVKENDARSFTQKAMSNLHAEWMYDPESARKRAAEFPVERLPSARIESLRELDAWKVSEAKGEVPRVEAAEQDGMFRVYAPARSAEKGRPEAPQKDSATSGQQQEGGKPAYTLMNGEQMTEYLQVVVGEQQEFDILFAQRALASDVMVQEGVRQGYFDAAEVITDEGGNVTSDTLLQMKARADHAMSAIRALQAEGVSLEDARVQIDPAISGMVPLGAFEAIHESFKERADVAISQGDLTAEQAENGRFGTNAYVVSVPAGRGVFQRVMRYARGLATPVDLMEETMEQAVLSWCAEQRLSLEHEFGGMLLEAQRVINELYPEARAKEMQFIALERKGAPVSHQEAVEAFSKMGRARWLADAVENSALPGWLRKLLNHLVQFLGMFRSKVELGNMLRRMDEAGKLSLPLRQMVARMLDAGNALYRDQQGDLIALTMERAKVQGDLDAALGRGVAMEPEVLEDQLAERNAEDEPGPVELAEEGADDGAARQARRERAETEVDVLGEEDGDGIFNGGVSIRIEDGVRQGFVDKDRLTLCPEVAQFKQGADVRTGVVNRIVGAWQRNAAPISIWRRKDGSLQVISGRHRLDACTDADINCTVYDEGDRFNVDWARRHDVENNIRDGQASAFEIARYVRESSMTMSEAVERGIARKGASLKGVELGLYAGQEVLDALGNGLVSADDAYRVANAFRSDSEVQRSGLAVLLDGGSFSEAYSVMMVRANMERIRAVAESGGMRFETDLFGNSNADAYLRRLAEYANRRQRELSSELAAISGAARKPEVARKYGVNVRDQAALDSLIKEMKEKARRWKSFGIHEDLLKEANDAVMVEMGLKSREDVDAENGVLPLDEQDGSGDNATGELMFARDVNRMLDAARKMGTTPAEGGTPVTNFSIVSIPSGDVVRTVPEMREQLKLLQGRVFTNKNTGIQAVIEARVSAKTKGKAGASQMSVANLKRFGISVEDARTIHYTAATHIHELFENAEDALFERSYKDDPSRAGAYHLFNTVEVEGFGKFDVNVTAIAPENKERINTLYTIELTIENPSNTSEEVPLSHGGVSSDTSGVSTRNLSSYRSFVEKEKASIKKKAVADGTFMKAPNGADTNLTEDQWLSVRTEAFKRWFGDWENTPQNASKVVDENGEPRVVFHGTDERRHIFDTDYLGSKSGGGAGTNYGFFFAYNYNHAQYWADNATNGKGGVVEHVFLNIRDPWEATIEDDGGLSLEREANNMDAYCNDGAILDGVIDDDTMQQATVAIVAHSNQIKSATDNRGTFDGGSPDITFSIAEAQEQGLFRDGHFEADHAVITEPGVTFSITALHASPHSFRKFVTDNMGGGEGNQAFGWGLYFAESPEVNKAYMNQFAKDVAIWRFKDLEASNVDDMARGLRDRIKLPENASRVAMDGALDTVYDVLGDLSDARGDKKKIDAIKDKLRDDIRVNENYTKNYPDTKNLNDAENVVCQFLVDHLDEIEVAAGSPSNYRVELNVDDSVLMDWDYVDEAILALLKDSTEDAVGNALEYAEERADYRGENVSGKGVYKALFDAFWDGGDDTRQDAQKEASLALLASGIKGIKYEDGFSRGKKAGKTYNYVIFDENDIKVTAFVDKSTGGAWEDYADQTATFSIIGEKAESFMDYHNNGLSYMDPADGKRKAIVDSRGVRLKKDRISVSEGGHVNVSLAAVLDFPELFRAYPVLRKLRVDFYRDGKSNTGGFTDPLENYIAVNVARRGNLADTGLMLDTILHEVQHVIQGYEGFAMGAGNMNKDQALAYLDESMKQLKGRSDDWAKDALPRLERMRRDLEEESLQPAFVYIFSHGEQEARLAGTFGRNSAGVVMSGLNGFRLLDAPKFSIPLTGNITELGGITFGAGRFGRMADRILSPNGDWLYDEMVFKMRAAVQRTVKKLDLYEGGDKERGLSMIAECQELISTVERYLPHTYGFGLEPYKIWLNVFSLLYSNGNMGAALEAIPMAGWPEIMKGSFTKAFMKYIEQTGMYQKDGDINNDEFNELFRKYGEEFLMGYGEAKISRLIEKFMERVVQQIDRYRKDRTLGRIRRVVASVAPKKTPQGKPLRGRMDVESYKRLADYMRLLEMTEAQYEAFFRKQFPDVLESDGMREPGEDERTSWEVLEAHQRVTVETVDDEGKHALVSVTKQAFETYACFEQMDVERAEACSRALGELITTSRDAWENAHEKRKLETAAMLRPVFMETGRINPSDKAKMEHAGRAVRAVWKRPLTMLEIFMNAGQLFDALSHVKGFEVIARTFRDRVSNAQVHLQEHHKDRQMALFNAIGEVSGLRQEDDLYDWARARQGMKEDTGIDISEQEPDWMGKARREYRDGLLKLVRRKVRKHGADKVQLHLSYLFKLESDMKEELERTWPTGGTRPSLEEELRSSNAVFTVGELTRYGNQAEYVQEHAQKARGKSRYAGDGYEPESYRLEVSRLEAAYLVMLGEQEDYREALRMTGFDAAVLERLSDYAGGDCMKLAYVLRDKLNERSQDVKGAMERRTGTPFPLVENYFRAFFDIRFKQEEKSIGDAAAYGNAAGGGRFGMIYARKKQQRLRLDLNMDIITAFNLAMQEQDVFLHFYDVANDLQYLLNYEGPEGRAETSLNRLLGVDTTSRLREWVNAFTRTAENPAPGQADMNRLLNSISGAAARILLPGRWGTWIKQFTGVINTLYSSDAFSASDWAGSVRRWVSGKLAMPVREMMRTPELDSRDRSAYALTERLTDPAQKGKHVSRLERWNRKGGDDLERRDMQANAVSCAVLYDSVYRKMMRENPDAGRELAHEAAMQEVRRSLATKGQPMTASQRSLFAQRKFWATTGMLFLGGESINTGMKAASLMSKGQLGKSMAMWSSHGLLIALIDAALRFFTDDEKQRKKRSWWDLMYYMLAGPLAGIPLVSGGLGYAFQQTARSLGLKGVYAPGNNAVVPGSNLLDFWTSCKRVVKVFDGKDRPWQDYPLAFTELLRGAAMVTVVAATRNSKGSATAAGAALATAAMTNFMESLLKVTRSFQENVVD